MDAAAYPEVPVKMMNAFHAMDRQLYSILVFELERDPMVSLNVIAFWIWLEQNEVKNGVDKIRSFPKKLINGLADEAVTCLIGIKEPRYLLSTDATEISLTQNLLGNHLSLEFFYENGAKALCGIRMVVENVCVKVLNDLMKMAIAGRQLPPSVSDQQLLKTQMVMIPRFGPIFTGESSGEGMEEPKDDRKMFVTFSKGYHVSKQELWGYLNSKFGEDCVESISMQVVKPNEQSLFAVTVFTSSAIVDLVLRGQKMAKFKIKGKRVWMQKFIPKARQPL